MVAIDATPVTTAAPSAPTSSTTSTAPTAATRATQLIAHALERLAQETDQARFSTEMTRYFTVMGRFHRYSPTNQLLIALQRPDATLVAGFRRWLARGRCVRKGERGIVILAPVVPRTGPQELDKDEVQDRYGAHRAGREAIRRAVAFRAAYVFDVAQTDALPGQEAKLPQLDWSVDGDHEGSYQRLLAVATAKGIPVEWAYLDPGHYGTSFGGRIELGEALREDSGHRCLVLAHELAHELLHKTEAGRTRPRAVKELEAEATAYVVGEYLGVPTVNAPRYAALYGGTAGAIRETYTAVSRAARALLTALGE